MSDGIAKMRLTLSNDELEALAMSAIKERMVNAINHRSLIDVTDRVISDRRDELIAFLGECLSSALDDPAMKETMRDEFRHKVAKNLVAKLEGSVEKAVQSYINDPTRRARMIIAIERMIEEPQP